MNELLPTVFISEPIDAKGLHKLEGFANIVLAPDTSRDTTIALLAQADAAILRATTIFDEEVIRAGVNLKVIARTGVGVNNVDLKAAGKQGIYVCNTPGTNDDTVAEHTMALILALAKQLFTMDRAVRNQHWGERFSPRQMDLQGKRVGIIGYGNIGQATARLCDCFGMHVTVYDPFVDQKVSGISFTEDLSRIFRLSDFVCLHCPVTSITKGLVGKKYLDLMHSGAYLINTSRGELIDEDALVEALTHKKIAGAALDVFETEPVGAASPFLQFPDVILSPHVAGSTKESNERIAVAAAQAVIDVLSGKTPQHVCNSEYLTSLQNSR